MELTNLPLTGTYLLQISTAYAAITGGTVTLSSDMTGTLTANTPFALNLRVGQQARLTFAGTAATHALNVGTPTTGPSGQSLAITVLDSGGNQVASGSFNAAGALNLGSLTAGSYTVLVVPATGVSANVTLTYQ
jgi:hypothetical protein